MINIFKTEQSVIRTIDAFEDGAWVQMVDPSVQELNKVSEAYDIEVSDLATALDEEESSRISLEDGYTLILVDIPSPVGNNRRNICSYSHCLYVLSVV